VISYRTTSSFERYNEGRRLWSQIIFASRTFSRTVWFHVHGTFFLLLEIPKLNLNTRTASSGGQCRGKGQEAHNSREEDCTQPIGGLRSGCQALSSRGGWDSLSVRFFYIISNLSSYFPLQRSILRRQVLTWLCLTRRKTLL
jgi:hypothetical protein